MKVRLGGNSWSAKNSSCLKKNFQEKYNFLTNVQMLEAKVALCSSSPRAESARAVTGRRCPHSGTGQDFLARNGPNRTNRA